MSRKIIVHLDFIPLVKNKNIHSPLATAAYFGENWKFQRDVTIVKQDVHGNSTRSMKNTCNNKRRAK